MQSKGHILVVGESGTFYRWGYNDVCENRFAGSTPETLTVDAQATSWAFNDELTEGLVGSRTSTI